MKRILFTTPFKPYGIDNQYSRVDSFPECFHNRLTRAHGIYSYRGHFSAFGLHAIANNIEADSTVLEYPTYERFLKELDKGYDYIGIGSVMPNLGKVKVMAEAVRERSPQTKIVVGGYCAHVDDISSIVPLDYLCTGEGVSFMRELLGQSPEFDFKNPDVYSQGKYFLGVPMIDHKNPHIIIGLGCPYGCEYCAPSHHFGRKYIRFFKTGKEIFDEMERMERVFKSRSFGFIGDDNFLLDIDRAEELRQLITKSGKQYETFYFASPKQIMDFGPDRMAEIGTNFVWFGRESTLIPMDKHGGVDMKEMVDELHRHGIKAMVSTILCMEHHTPDNIWTEVDEHLKLSPDFSMLSLYSALPGTPFYDKVKEEGRINWDMPYEEWNGLWRQWFFNPNFSAVEGQRVHERALEMEFEVLGPAPVRLIRTELEGYRHMKNSKSEYLRGRAEHFKNKMWIYRSMLSAMSWLAAPGSPTRDTVNGVLSEVEKETGKTRAFEKVLASGLYAFGAKEKIKHRLIGDVIQPSTNVTRYPAAN